MRIGFIGAGKVGFTLGKFFVEGGVPVTGYWSRQREHMQEAALFTGTKQYDTLAALVDDSDALFLTVTDGAISAMFAQLCTETALSGKQICHCSGAMTAGEAFPGLSELGAYGYSIHPLFPISDPYRSWRELTGAFFCLEGDEAHLAAWQEMLTALGAQARRISGAEKARYHAACVFASNLVCALAAESTALLERCGFSPEDARRALAPLMRSNLEHLLQDGPAAALTGPVERGDAATVAKHLACLPNAQTRALYRTASRTLLAVAQEKHPERDYRETRQVLWKQEMD